LSELHEDGVVGGDQNRSDVELRQSDRLVGALAAEDFAAVGGVDRAA
jgi:hypothetical protein